MKQIAKIDTDQIETAENEKFAKIPTPKSRSGNHFMPGGRISHLAATEMSNYPEDRNRID
jgi:hypothetical protein